MHVGDLFKKILVLVVILDLDLLECGCLIFDGNVVNMGIASADFLLHFDVFKTVVSFHDGVVGKKIKHDWYIIINNLLKHLFKMTNM